MLYLSEYQIVINYFVNILLSRTQVVSNISNSSVIIGAYRIAMEVPLFDATNNDYVDKMYAIVIKDPDLETGGLPIPNPFNYAAKDYLDQNLGCDDVLTAKLYRFNFNNNAVNSSFWIDKGWLCRIDLSPNGTDPCGNRIYQYNFNPTGSYESGGIDMSRAQSFGVSPTDANTLFFGDVKMGICTTGLDDNFGNYQPLSNPFVHDDIHSIKTFPDATGLIAVGDGGVTITSSITSGLGFGKKNKGLNIADVLRFSISQTKKDVFALGLLHCGSAISRDNKWFVAGGGDGITPLFLDENNIFTSSQGGNFKKYIWNGTNYTYTFINSLAEVQDWNSFAIFNQDDPTKLFMPTYNNYTPDQNNLGQWLISPTGKNEIVRKKPTVSGIEIEGLISDYYSQFNTPLNGSITWKMYNTKANPNYLLVHLLYTIYPDTPQEQTIHRLFYNLDVNNSDVNIIKSSWQELILPFTNVGWVNDIYIDENDANKFWAVLANNFTQSQLWYHDNSSGWTIVPNDFNTNYITLTSVVKQPGTKRIYVGTKNNGVLTADFSISSSEFGVWKQFNDNLPYANVADLEIMECEGLLRTGTFGRGIWEADLVPENTEPYIVSTDEIINTNKHFNQSIIIKNNAKLTVNAELSLNKFNTIIVERGSQLIIDGPDAKITNACQARWPGIQVWGNSNVPQNSANAAQFGKVIVRNGGTIENAETAITTMKIDDQGNWDWNYSGGIVQCTDANFINNWHDVGFLNYTNYNANGQEMITQSYFTRTNFTTNENYNYKEFGAPDWHVTIDHSSGIRFKGCTFKNLKTTPPTDYSGTEHLWAGGGIYAINSQVFVDQYCSGFTINCNNAIPTTFENLREGILVTGTLKNRKLNCLHSKFINNATNGIYVRSQNYANIIANDFIYNTDNLYNYEANTGLYQIGALISLSTGYRIEENNFTGNANGTYSQAGIKIVNSGGAPNEIYRNTFTNLYYGATALGTNKNTKINANGVGLQLLCLTHQNNRWDNAVTKKFDEPGIALYQGNLLGPNFRTADNTFSNITGTACTDVFNYYNECEFINYAGSSNIQYSPSLYDCNSIYVSNNIAYNTGCPTKVGWHKKLTSTEKQSALNNLHTKSIELQNAKNVLSLVTDGGNTNSVINAIAQSQPAQTQQLVSDLMSLSPNVSIPVLLKVAHEDDKMSPTLQMLVLIANTQGGKNQKIIDTLRNKQNPMDPAMIDYILDNRNNTSLKEKIESQVNTLVAEKDYFALVLLNDFMEDTIGVDKDSIAMLIDQMEGDEKYYAKIFAAVNDNNFMLCDSLYNNLGDSIENRYSLADYESISEIIALEKTLMASNRNYHQLDINEIESLRSLARGEYATKGMMMAQNILENAVGDEFEPYLKFPEEVQERRSKPQGEKLAMPATIENAFFKVYPNPTKSQTNLSYVLLPGQKGVASISDSNGKVVFETILSNDQNSLSLDLSNLAPSTYFLRVLVNNEVKYNETLVIRK
jgi:hypothetical protein